MAVSFARYPRSQISGAAGDYLVQARHFFRSGFT